MTVLPQQEAAYMPYITVTEERTGGTGPTGISNLRNFCISNYPFQRAYRAQLCFLYARHLLLRSFLSSGGSVPSKTSSRQGHPGCLSVLHCHHTPQAGLACLWMAAQDPASCQNHTSPPAEGDPLSRGFPSPGHNQGEEAMQAARAGGSREGAVPVGQPFPACHCLPQGAQGGKSHTARISMNTRKTERKKENNNKTKKTNLPSAHGNGDPHAWQVLGCGHQTGRKVVCFRRCTSISTRLLGPSFLYPGKSPPHPLTLHLIIFCK